MPLIASNNRNTIILNDIVNWLSQIKVAGVPNQRILLGDKAIISGNGFDLPDITLDQLANLTVDQLGNINLSELDCCIDFYLDKERTQYVFTDCTGAVEYGDLSQDFSIIKNQLYYTPPDAFMNAATGLSSEFNQPIYYWTAEWTDGTVKQGTYRNCDNLLFQSVICATKPNPQFATNGNEAIIVPQPEKTESIKVSGDFIYLLCTYDVYIQQIVLNYDKLSEQQRIAAQQQVVNTLRNTLYLDRSRNGQCTFHDKDIRGTYVGDMKPMKSDALLKCSVRVQTSSLVLNNGF